jgi:hypothetical protein
MKVTIKKTHEIDGHWFKLIDENNKIKYFSFDPNAKDDSLYNEKKVLEQVMKLAKEIEIGLEADETIYETGKNINPLAYFMAANMSEEEIQNTIGVDLSKIDEP